MGLKITRFLLKLAWKLGIHVLDKWVEQFFTKERALAWRRRAEDEWIAFGEYAKKTNSKADDTIFEFGQTWLKSSRLQQQLYRAH